MEIASGFVVYIIVLFTPPVLYFLHTIYIQNCKLRIHWTQRARHWTKGAKSVLRRAAAASSACNAAISAAGWALCRACGRISRAYLRRMKQISAAVASTLREPAVWWNGCTRRQGRGPVPHEAVTRRIQLKPTQQQALAPLESGERAELTRGEYEQLAEVSRSQAAYDLAELVEGGVLRRVGGGRATRYRLARESRPAQRHWTDERIRAELKRFCAGRKAWPSAGDFKAAGHADLYVAASRYGGIGFWAAELGFARPGRAGPPRVAETPLRRKLAWAGAGAVASAALAVAAVTVVQLSLPRQTPRTAAPIRIAPAAASDESSHAVRKSRSPARAVKKTAPVRRTHPRAARHVETAPTQPTSTSNSRSLIAVRTYSPPTTYRAPAVHTTYTSTRTPTPSGGPAPLRAPLTASGPTPLKAP
jgi:hypothetical protein